MKIIEKLFPELFTQVPTFETYCILCTLQEASGRTLLFCPQCKHPLGYSSRGGNLSGFYCDKDEGGCGWKMEL